MNSKTATCHYFAKLSILKFILKGKCIKSLTLLSSASAKEPSGATAWEIQNLLCMHGTVRNATTEYSGHALYPLYSLNLCSAPMDDLHAPHARACNMVAESQVLYKADRMPEQAMMCSVDT
eukprot:122477-Pelagomonas_calceolata.AAC.10